MTPSRVLEINDDIYHLDREREMRARCLVLICLLSYVAEAAQLGQEASAAKITEFETAHARLSNFTRLASNH